MTDPLRGRLGRNLAGALQLEQKVGKVQGRLFVAYPLARGLDLRRKFSDAAE
jgi:hypothetical protein